MSGAARAMLAMLGMLAILPVVEGLEVCSVDDLQLVTQTGEFFLAAGFLLMGSSAIVLTMISFKASEEKRKFFFCACFMMVISCFTYYAMLSGQAWLITPNCRQLFYARYLESAVTLPLAVLAMGLVAGADGVLVSSIMGGMVLLTFSDFMAAITGGFIRWMWFALQIVLTATTVAGLALLMRGGALRRHPSIPELYNKLLGLTVAGLVITPLVWICAEGIGYWSPNFEILVYVLLEVVSKVAFGFVLVLSHEATDQAIGSGGFAALKPAYGSETTRPVSLAVESYV